jgi:hypothetical protein
MNPSKLEWATFQLVVKLHCKPEPNPRPGFGPHYRSELAAVEAALRTSAIERELLDDLPRMIELERRTHGVDFNLEWVQGWNAALEQAAALARFALSKG